MAGDSSQATTTSALAETSAARQPNAASAPAPVPRPAASSPTSQPSAAGQAGAGAVKRKKKATNTASPPPPPPPKHKSQLTSPPVLAAAGAAAGLALLGIVQLVRKLRGSPSGKGTQGPNAPCAHVKPSAKCVALADGSACVVRRQIPADNSCLFNAVAYCMHGSKQKAAFLRGVVAREVSSDPETYTSAFLGMPNAAYCNWIMQPHNWGGGIELAILARHYGREIGAWNIESGKQHVFGEDAGYPKCVMLIYTGTHYDALAIAKHPRAPESEDKTEFNPRTKAGKMAVAAAQKLVQLSYKGPKGSRGKTPSQSDKLSTTPALPAKKTLTPLNARQSSATASNGLANGQKSVASVRMKREECGVVCGGQAEAAKHAGATGHTRFAQMAAEGTPTKSEGAASPAQSS